MTGMRECGRVNGARSNPPPPSTPTAATTTTSAESLHERCFELKGWGAKEMKKGKGKKKRKNPTGADFCHLPFHTGLLSHQRRRNPAVILSAVPTYKTSF